MTSSIVISEGDIHGIVTILIEDAELVQSKQKLYNSMGLPYGEFVDIERRAFFSGSSESYVFFNLTLTKWVQFKENGATLDVLLNTLREENFNLSASKLITWTPDPTPTATFPTPSVGVFGKDLPTNGWLSEPVILPGTDLTKIYPRTQNAELITETIKQSLENNNTIVMHGPNGYGKSTIAILYAFLNYRKYSYMIWLEAKTLSKLESNIKDLAHKLGIPTAFRLNLDSEKMTQKSLGQLFDEIYSKLKGRKCLIVFDNVMIAQQIQLYLPGPQYTNDFHVVLTARHPIEFLRNFELTVFVPEEAVHFLCKELGVTSDQEMEVELVKKFAEKVGYLPLALQLLIVPEIENTSVHLREYLNDQETVVTPGVQLQLQSELPEYPEGVYKAFEVAMNAAKNDLLKTYDVDTVETTMSSLHLAPFLNPDDIPYEMFNCALKIEEVLPCLQVLVDRKILVRVPTSGALSRDIIRISTVWQKILQIRLQNYETPIKNKTVRLGIEIGVREPNDSNGLRDNLWEFIAVKTTTLFESFNLRKLCWRNHYFDPHFCRGKIIPAHFFKLLSFRLILSLRFWCLNILIPSIIGVAIGRISVIGTDVDFLESLILILIFIFGFVGFGSLSIFFIESALRLPGYNFFRTVVLPVKHLIMFFIYLGMWAIWISFIVPMDRCWKIGREDEKLKKLLQILLSSLLVMDGGYMMRSVSNAKGWKFLYSRLLITYGTFNVLNGFIFILIVLRKWTLEQCRDTLLIFDIIDWVVCGVLIFTFFIYAWCKYYMPRTPVDDKPSDNIQATAAVLLVSNAIV